MALNIGAPRIQVFIPGTQQPASGYKIFTRYGSLSTSPGDPIATYPTIADAINLTNPNSNPVVLDSNGMANIVVTGATKLILTDENGDVNSPVWSFDNLGVASTNVYDSNGNLLLEFNAVNDPQNWVKITNATSGAPPSVTAAGNDLNVNLRLGGQGTGGIEVPATAAINIANITTANLTTANIITDNVSTLNVSAAANLPTASNTLNILPAGVIWPYAGQASTLSNMISLGWLECNGQVISRTVYANLFAAVGTSYGAGDGSTTFAVPQLQRTVIMGRGGTAVSGPANTIGSSGGTEAVTLTASQIPSNFPSTTTVVARTLANTALGADFPAATGSTAFGGGGGTSHTNVQPSLVMTYFIKI